MLWDLPRPLNTNSHGRTAAEGQSIVTEKGFNPATITSFPNKSYHFRIKSLIPEQQVHLGTYFSLNTCQNNHGQAQNVTSKEINVVSNLFDIFFCLIIYSSIAALSIFLEDLVPRLGPKFIHVCIVNRMKL